MAIASSLSSSKSLLERFRSPVFIASALSLGAHGIFFAAMPMLSASEDSQEQEESVPVVALSAEESQRLPDAVRGDRSEPFAMFGDAPLATQDGDLSLPVPGSPPFGDLSGLDSSFDSLPTTTSPLWGNPLDIFPGSLPTGPGETSVIFPETSGFDSLGSQAFEIPMGGNTTGGMTFDDSPIAAGNVVDDALGEEVPGIQPESDDIVGEPEPGDAPLFDGSNEAPGSGLSAPAVAPEGGTTIGNAFSGEDETEAESGQQEPASVDPNSLAQSLPADGAENEAQPNDGSVAVSPPEEDAPTLDSQDPMMIAFREKQRLYRSYTNNQQGLADAAQVGSSMGRIASEQSLTLQPAQRLVIQYPDPDFQCPADASPALFTLVIPASDSEDGSTALPQLEQSTQYPALDSAATDAATTHAEGLTEPGVYSLEIRFQDDTESCVASEPIS